jgi:hypothetical protein
MTVSIPDPLADLVDLSWTPRKARAEGRQHARRAHAEGTLEQASKALRVDLMPPRQMSDEERAVRREFVYGFFQADYDLTKRCPKVPVAQTRQEAAEAAIADVKAGLVTRQANWFVDPDDVETGLVDIDANPDAWDDACWARAGSRFESTTFMKRRREEGSHGMVPMGAPRGHFNSFCEAYVQAARKALTDN